MTVSLVKITADMAGCWFAGSGNRSADELNSAVITTALEFGWELRTEDSSWFDSLVWPDDSSWCDDDEYGTNSQGLSELAREACDYLNGLAPAGYYFTFDDGFYLFSDSDDDDSEYSA